MDSASGSDEGPVPHQRLQASFTGGIHQRPGGGGASFPFGHLEFDDEQLRMWGFGKAVAVRREAIRGVRLSTGILATRVSVVYLDGSESNVYFAALGRGPVRQALQERGWPVIDERLRGRPGPK